MDKTGEKTGAQKRAETGRKNLIPGYKTKVKKEQPTPDQKKAGWERRRNGQMMMNKMLQYQAYTKDELLKLLDDKKTPLIDMLMIKYVIGGIDDPRLLVDFIDRHVPKAPQKMELTGDEGEPIQHNIIVKIKR